MTPLEKEMLSLIDDLNYVLTNVWKPDYRSFYEKFKPRCEAILNAAQPEAKE
jgi:hypothetical protein